jgi:signal transduction histidine kinase
MPTSAPDLTRVGDRLKFSIDHLLEGVQVIAPDWTYLYLNDSAAAHGQRRAADLVGRTMMACYPGIEATPVFAVLRRVMERREPETLRNEFVFPDGTRRWFDLRVEPVPDGICIMSLDVTHSHQLEVDRREHEARTQFALRAAQMGVWHMTLATGEMSWSETMADMGHVAPGAGPKTFEGFLEWVEPDDRARVRAAADRAIASRGEFTVQFRVNLPDGQQRWMEAHARVTVDRDGQPERIAGVGLDITARRSTERQLQLSQKMEAVGRLAGGIAHDFNNQLAVIRGFADLALQAVDPGSQIAQDLEEVRNAGERATVLTRQLLAFSRRQVFTIEPVNLNEVVANTGRLLERLLGEDVVIDVRLDPELPRTLGDVSQLENVITNLAVNARDAMPGGGRLTLRTSQRALTEADVRQNTVMQPGHYAVLSVTDNGHGMDEATQARIFEPFFTTKDPGKGTGLGLSTVYGIVKQMEGFVWVYSEPGSGTTFRLYFPVTDEAPVSRAAPPPEPLPRGRGTVLVVEDEPGLRRFTVRALTEQGYTVLEAGSADEARVQLDQHGASIDLVLADVVLPGQSGPELLAGRVPPVRALFMSGYSAQHVHEASGPEDLRLLEKPFTVRELLARVQEALAERA